MCPHFPQMKDFEPLPEQRLVKRGELGGEAATGVGEVFLIGMFCVPNSKQHSEPVCVVSNPPRIGHSEFNR